MKLLKKPCQELVAMAGSRMWGYGTDNVGLQSVDFAVSARNPGTRYTLQLSVRLVFFRAPAAVS